MGERRSKFAGGDQAYLQNRQYATADRLAARANLHSRWSTASTSWFDWINGLVELRPGIRVLEVGCGAGWQWEALGSLVPDGVSLALVDLSRGMVEEAVQRAPLGGGLTAVAGHVADAQSLPVADRCCDRVIANHMLYHLPDPEAGVAELSRVLRPDGRAVVATNGGRHLHQLEAIRAEVFGGDANVGTADVFGIDNGLPMLQQRFREVRWMAREDDLRCASSADVIAYLRSMPPGEDASLAQLEELQLAVERAFAADGGVLRISKETGCFVCAGPR